MRIKFLKLNTLQTNRRGAPARQDSDDISQANVVSSVRKSRRLTGMNTFLSVFVVASMAALVAVWRIGDFIPFYVVLTAVMAVAAGVNLFMVFRRVHGLKEDLSPGEYRSAGVLLWMVTMVLSAVGGVCFAFAVNERIVASYPVIFSAVPVFMLLINGYINFIEAHVRERKIEMERQIAESNDVSD